MYAMAQQEAWRQRHAEIRQQVAALRLEKTLRTNGEPRWRTGPGADRAGATVLVPAHRRIPS